MAGWVEIVAAVSVGGLGATWLQEYLAVRTQRRIRRDEERESALHALVRECARLEEHTDFMLSPERLSPDGVFQTNSMYPAEEMVRGIEDCWRVQAEPYVPEAMPRAAAVLAAWHEVQAALNGTNPPVPEFFDKIADLRAAAAAMRADAQVEIARPKRSRKRRGRRRSSKAGWKPGHRPEE